MTGSPRAWFNFMRWKAIRILYCGVRRLPVHKGRGLMLRLLEHLVHGIEGTISFDQGQRILVDPRDHIEGIVYRHGVYEPEATAAFCKLLATGVTVIDVGAHVGYYTLLAACRVGRLGSVHSFEPVSETFERLRANVLLNSYENVHVNCLALSTNEDSFSVHPSNTRLTGSSSFLIRPENDPVPIKVPCTTLDAYVEQQGLQRLDLVKVDVEGAELLVLHGARKTIASYAPDFICELHCSLLSQAGYTLNEVLDFMGSLGYQAFRIEATYTGITHHVYFSRQPKLLLAAYSLSDIDMDMRG